MQPQAASPTVISQMFFIMMLARFAGRTDPASNKAKPPCMPRTATVLESTHAWSLAAIVPHAVGASWTSAMMVMRLATQGVLNRDIPDRAHKCSATSCESSEGGFKNGSIAGSLSSILDAPLHDQCYEY